MLSWRKSRYIAGWEIDFNDRLELTKILLTQGVDLASFNLFTQMQSGMELIIKANKIVEVIEHSNGKKECSKNTNIPIPIMNWPNRKLFFLEKALNGSHSVGGQNPNNFTLPSHEGLNSPFIYLCTINGKDQLFKWLNIDLLHISYPIYEGAFELFLDYENPSAPKIMNPETFTYSWQDNTVNFSQNPHFLKHTYSIVKDIKLENIELNNDDFLICGVPMWYQYPQIPTCPKTNKIMRFVATINSDPDLKISNHEMKGVGFGDYLSFGDHGNLYIFYEPDSKVMHLNMQF